MGKNSHAVWDFFPVSLLHTCSESWLLYTIVNVQINDDMATTVEQWFPYEGVRTYYRYEIAKPGVRERYGIEFVKVIFCFMYLQS